MPMYEYRCRTCDEAFEELVRMGTLASDVVCPRCKRRDCERLLSVFSGGGTSARGHSGHGSSRAAGRSGFS